MSRTIQTATAVAAFLATFSVHAASINVVQSPTASGIAYAIYIDDTGIGNYNVIDVRTLPNPPSQFLNHDPDGVTGATLLAPGANASFINALLTFPLVWGFATPIAENGPDEFYFGTGPLGQYIELTEPLFLNNVVLPVGATGTTTITLLDTGNAIFSQTVRLGVPEPGSLILGALSFVGCAVIRRFSH